MYKQKTLFRLIPMLVLALILAFRLTPKAAASSAETDRAVLIEYARKMYFELEGHYDSVTAKDVNAVSIGFMQWHGENALYLLKSICSADPTLSNQTLGALLYDEIVQTPMWRSEAGSGWKSRVLTKPEAVAVRRLIDTETGRSCQDRYAKSFISSEIDHAISQHISTDAAIVYFCSIENQYGPSGARSVLQRARSAMSMPDGQPITSLDVLHRGILAAAESHNSISAHLPYRKNVYAFLTGTLKLPAGPVEVTTPVPAPSPETTNHAPAPEATSESAPTSESPSQSAPNPAPAPAEITAPTPGTEAAEIKQAVGTVVASGLRLREEPSTASRILGIAPRNEKVLIVSMTGEWCKVRFGQKAGYMHRAYLVQREAENVAFGLARFNVCANIRTENHTGSAILDTANRGNLCVITGFDHGWFRILCGGKDGYVRSDLVSLVGE